MLIFVLSVRIFRSTLFNSKWPISSWIQDLNLNLFYVWKVKLLVFLNVILIPTPFLQNTGSSYKGINSGLTTYFFGENKEGNLTVDKFLEFQRQLQNEILRLEFNRKSSGSNTIPEKAFVELLIAYAGFPGIFTNFLHDFSLSRNFSIVFQFHEIFWLFFSNISRQEKIQNDTTCSQNIQKFSSGCDIRRLS